MSLISLYEGNTEMFETGADDVGQKIFIRIDKFEFFMTTNVNLWQHL